METGILSTEEELRYSCLEKALELNLTPKATISTAKIFENYVRNGAPASESNDDIPNTDVMELFVGPLPMHVNLGGWDNLESVIGWARGYRKSDGTTHIAIQLDEEASKRLANLAEVFELKAVGFAGIARRPQNGG